MLGTESEPTNKPVVSLWMVVGERYNSATRLPAIAIAKHRVFDEHQSSPSTVTVLDVGLQASLCAAEYEAELPAS